MKSPWTKEELINEITKRDFVTIDLGCGPNPNPNIIGLDSLPLEGVHYVTDLEKGLPFLEDNSVDKVTSRHFMEHIENFEQLISEIYRVLKVGGENHVIVPYWVNPHYYSDYTHKRFFGLYTFEYLSNGNNDKPLKRKVPTFYNNINFNVFERTIVFRDGNNQVLNLWKKRILQPLFNASTGTQEFYEFYLSYLFPASEIIFKMKK